MEYLRAPGVNTALFKVGKSLLKNGRFYEARGTRRLGFPYPITIEITNPRARHILIPERKWRCVLPYTESAWMLTGSNNLDDLPGYYVQNLYNYSDDTRYWRGGYGPRLRFYDGAVLQYSVSHPRRPQERYLDCPIDQLQYVVDAFERDPGTFQAIINIGDPMKDLYGAGGDILQTRDFPCTRSLHFIPSPEGKLNLHVLIRSNDLLFGASAVNWFNWTFMQEYMSSILGMEIGSYFHTATNMHVYENFISKLESILSSTSIEECEKFDEEYVEYETPIASVLSTMYELVENSIIPIEKKFHKKSNLKKFTQFVSLNVRGSLYWDWMLVFWKENLRMRKMEGTPQYKDYSFVNPALNRIYG